MRDLWKSPVHRYRIRTHLGVGDETCGAFTIPSPIDGGDLRVMASSGAGWDHVSVSRAKRTPNWPEMEHVRKLFFNDDESAMQLGVPDGDHANFHEFCLHWWRPQAVEIPRPPAWMVGPKAGQSAADSIIEGLLAQGESA